MAWAEVYKVVLGSFAFIIFWTLATFPSVSFLPIGRTAGALLGGTLMVVFQVMSPAEAFAAIDLPILGLLFGTMVVSVYLERAGLFRYLKVVLSWKCRGARDLLVRISIFSGLASALFTNDTICVIFTEFVLDMCAQQGLPPEPFLLALASSANIGSATTPIGNPQNLVIAIESKIGFGKFLIGVLPAMAAGIVFNIVFLLALYWKQLSSAGVALPVVVDPTAAPAAAVEHEEIANNNNTQEELKSPGTRSPLAYARLDSSNVVKTSSSSHHHELEGDHEPYNSSPASSVEKPTQLYSSRVYSPVHPLPAEKQPQLYSPRVHSPGDRLHHHHIGPHSHLSSPASSPAVTAAHFYSATHPHANSRHSRVESPRVAEIKEPGRIHRQRLQAHLDDDHRDQDNSIQLTVLEDKAPGKVIELPGPWWKWGPTFKKRAWTIAVYGVTAGFLAALLSGLNLTWSALTAAVALMVLDFSDAGPSLDRVSYSLLVFFSGMFITVDGFNRTGAPGQFWNAVEPHTRIDTTKGVAILSLVVLVLSNVASNVPTVLLLGARVAASAAATQGASVTRSWLILAWVSTVAGNFTLIGSAANLIVCEQARQAKTNSYNLTFWAHLKFGIPSTLIVTTLGLPLIRG